MPVVRKEVVVGKAKIPYLTNKFGRVKVEVPRPPKEWEKRYPELYTEMKEKYEAAKADATASADPEDVLDPDLELLSEATEFVRAFSAPLANTQSSRDEIIVDLLSARRPDYKAIQEASKLSYKNLEARCWERDAQGKKLDSLAVPEDAQERLAELAAQEGTKVEADA